jgi:hypothetical protein
MTLMLETAGGMVLGVIALCVLSFAAAAVMGVQLAALWICRQAFQALGNHMVFHCLRMENALRMAQGL